MAEVKIRSTFFSKKLITCPICNTEFPKEELQTGRGRINAGDLTEELRRLYIPTKKYGLVNPLIYSIVVCPECYFASLLGEFTKATENRFANIDDIRREGALRKEMISKIFGTTIDFRDFRDTFSGLASYILGFACAGFFGKNSAPSACRGLFALRGAWLANDIFEKHQLAPFQELSKELYYQAYVNYNNALERQNNRGEMLESLTWMGPDVDINFGYDGLLYMVSLLNIKHLDTLKDAEQLIKIGQSKRILSRIFGVGKSSKEKPEALVSRARDLYAKANARLELLESKGLDTSIAQKIEEEEDENE